MCRACQTSYGSRRRQYRVERVTSTTITAAAHIPSSEAVTPASPANVCTTGAGPSRA